VVAKNDKQRFSLSADGNRIRANQGHSIPVDLKLEPIEPPIVLFHGTATRFLNSILKNGLKSGSRQHVHLSPDEATAIKVGQRHGKPVVLQIDSSSMHADGHVFYRSENNVWLTRHVPVKYMNLGSLRSQRE
jgi:putative RNA 2'-phosphotransferase